MLSRAFRLKKRDIARLYKKAKRQNADFLLVRFMPNFAKASRFAVVIPKSVVKGSVGRSRLKRKTHEALSEYRNLLNQNYDVMLSYRKIPDEKVIAPAIKEIFTKVLI